DSHEGRRLLAHELTHTIQQGDSSGSVQGKLEVSQPEDSNEREAGRVAELINESSARSIDSQERSATHRISRPTVSSGAARVARQKAQAGGLPDYILPDLHPKMLEALIAYGTHQNKEGPLKELRELFSSVTKDQAVKTMARLNHYDEFTKYFYRED